VLVGRRVAKLRTAHGESLREAAVRTGVSHTTIARIEKGEVTGSFHSTLRKIAEGYGVRMEFLLTGRDPKQDFEGAIRRLPADDRSRLYFASARTRTKIVLDFLLSEYPNEFSPEQLAQAIGWDPGNFQELLDEWDAESLPEELNLRLAETLSRMTGISNHWFRSGALGGDKTDLLPRETISSYIGCMKKAAQAGLSPKMVDMAIELLIMRTKDGAASKE